MIDHWALSNYHFIIGCNWVILKEWNFSIQHCMRFCENSKSLLTHLPLNSEEFMNHFLIQIWLTSDLNQHKVTLWHSLESVSKAALVPQAHWISWLTHGRRSPATTGHGPDGHCKQRVQTTMPSRGRPCCSWECLTESQGGSLPSRSLGTSTSTPAGVELLK